MKKFVLILLSVCILCIFAFAGCSTPIELFKIGTYEADEIEGEPFTKAKFIIQPITQEEYENANGINVIKNSSSSKENNVYYSFEMFFYDDSKGEYVQAEITNVKYSSGTAGTYGCEVAFTWGNELIRRDVGFIYGYTIYGDSYFYYGFEENEQYREVKWEFQYLND